MKCLQNYFEIEESIQLQIYNFIHASQLAGEDSIEFFEKSRISEQKLDFLKESKVIREAFLKCAVIYGLRDNHLR